MDWYLYLILAFFCFSFLFLGYYSKKKIFVLFACAVGIIIGVLIMAFGVSVPTGNNYSGSYNPSYILNKLLPDQNGNYNKFLQTDGNNTAWIDVNGVGGIVTSVTGSIPIFSSMGTTPNISIRQANDINSGFINATDWNTFNNKQNTLPKATASVSGYLFNIDWNTFNSKQDLLISGTNIKTINSTSVLGSGNIAIPTTNPAGANTQVQFNDSNSFGADTNFVWDMINNRLGLTAVSPRTSLELGGDGSILATGTYGAGWTEPGIGAGVRMLWYPRKAAFRAGEVTGTLPTVWSDANIGRDSVAFGYNNRASGTYAVATGSTNIASGSGSFTSGINNTTSGSYSSTLGNGNKTSSTYATSVGYQNISSGSASFTQGQNNTASGAYSYAGGNLSYAVQAGDYAQGDNAIASGGASFALGFGDICTGTGSLCVGYESMVGGRYIFTSYVSSTHRFTIYDPSMDVGYYFYPGAQLRGYDNLYLGNYFYATVSNRGTLGGGYSFVDITTDPIGGDSGDDYSWIIGLVDNAGLSTAGVAIGNSANARAAGAKAIGDFIVANSYMDTVLGQYNSGIPASVYNNIPSKVNWVGMDALFELGNGKYNSNTSLVELSNAITVLKSGDMGLSTLLAPTALFQVDRPTYASGLIDVSGTSITGHYTTEFRNTFKVGDSIIIAATSETRTIATITNDYTMTITSAGTSTSNSSYTAVPINVLSVYANGHISIDTNIQDATLKVNGDINAVNIRDTNLTSGRIAFVGVGSLFTDSNKLTYVDSNGELKIGTSTNAYSRLMSNSTNATLRMQYSANNYLSFLTSSTTTNFFGQFISGSVVGNTGFVSNATSSLVKAGMAEGITDYSVYFGIVNDTTLGYDVPKLYIADNASLIQLNVFAYKYDATSGYTDLSFGDDEGTTNGYNVPTDIYADGKLGIRVNYDNNVGVRNTIPVYPLDVNGVINTNAGYYSNGTAGIDKNITVQKNMVTTCDMNFLKGILVASSC